MRLRTLICCIGVICVSSTACEPSPPQFPVSGPAPRPALTCDHTSSGSTFVAAKVSKLSTGFNPVLAAAPLPANNMGPVTQQDSYYNTLTNAFDAAPDFFKDNLCGLDAVYIVQNTCNGTCTPADLINNSFGMRAYQTTGAPRYIATSVQLLLNPTLTLSSYETQRLIYLLQNLSTEASAWPHPPTYQAAPDTLVYSVLAAFAHEYGHVLWYGSFVSQPGKNIDRLTIYCQGKNKFNSFYPNGYWDQVTLSFNRWISFAQRQNNYHIPHLNQLKNQLDQHHFFPQADKALHDALADKGVADLLSVFSSNEDFVTAYELHVLKEAQLTMLSVQMYDNSGAVVPSDTVDILGKLSSGTDLSEKVKCF